MAHTQGIIARIYWPPRRAKWAILLTISCKLKIRIGQLQVELALIFPQLYDFEIALFCEENTPSSLTIRQKNITEISLV